MTEEILTQNKANGAQVETAAYAVALFAGKTSKHPQPSKRTRRELAELFTALSIRKNKDGQLFCPAEFKPGTTRAKENVQAVSCLVLDIDNGTRPEELTPQWEALGLAFFLYSTHSSRPDYPKWRAVFLLAASVPGNQWESVYRKLAAHLGEGHADPSCKDASRMYYLPSCPPEYSEHAFAFVHEGAPLNPDDFPEIVPQPAAPPVAASTPLHATDLIHRRYVEGARKKILNETANAANGDRNNALNKGSHAAGQLVGAGVLDRAAIEAELLGVATSIGLPATEAKRTIQSGLDAGEKQPRALPMPRIARLAASAKLNHEITAEEIPKPTLIDDKGNAEYEPAQLVALLHPKWPAQNLDSHQAHALRIRELLGELLCYSPNLGWLVYNGKCWQRDDKHATKTAARVADLTQAVRDESAHLYQLAAVLMQTGRAKDADAMSKAAKKHGRHTKQVESKAFIEGALHLAAGLLTVETELFDQKPWVIGFQNGTWDKGVWREHRREDYLLYLSPVHLDFEADRSEWMATLDRITAGDLDLGQMAQDVIGYIFSAASHLRLLPFFYGPKGTGKSTVTELAQTVLGDMAATIDPKKLQDSAARERLGADLWNRRLAACSEAGSQRLEAELLKTLSGGDRLAVRFLFREAFTAPPRHVLLMVTNDPPRMDAYDAALKDRVIALPFVHPLDNGAQLEFTGGKRIEAVRQDHESPLVRGFAAWAMEGLARVWSTQEIHRAQCAESATAQFWADTDQLTPFWETIDEAELLEGIGKSELRKRYELWCETEGARAIAARQWTRACKDGKGLKEERRTAGKFFWYLPKVTLVTKQTLFSKDTREELKNSCTQIENDPCFVTNVTNGENVAAESLKVRL